MNNGQPLTLTVVVVREAIRPLLSTRVLNKKGWTATLSSNRSKLVNGKAEVKLRKIDNRDVMRLQVAVPKMSEVQAVTTTVLKRAIEDLRSEVRQLKLGEWTPEHRELEEWTPLQRSEHERLGHSVHDPRCEVCMRIRGTLPRKSKVAEGTVNFDYAHVSDKTTSTSVTLMVAGGPRGEVFCRVVPKKGVPVQDAAKFLRTLKRRYGVITVRTDGEPSLKVAVAVSAEEAGVPVEEKRVEVPQSNGRAEQRVRQCKERVQGLFEVMKKKGVSLPALSHPLIPWVVRHAEWLSNHCCRSDVTETGLKLTPYEAHTGRRLTSPPEGLLDRVLVRKKSETGSQ